MPHGAGTEKAALLHEQYLWISGTNSPRSHSLPASAVNLLKIRLSSFRFFDALKKSSTLGRKLLQTGVAHYTNLATTQILYTFVFVYWNIRTKLSNPLSEGINSGTSQLRPSGQSSSNHGCYNFKTHDQKLLNRTAAVTGNTKRNE